MLAALYCEFATLRPMLAQLVILYCIVGIVLGISMQSLYPLAGCIGAMTPFLLTFTLSGYDAMNGWERYRAALPLSRSGIVFGRYAIVLLATIAMVALGVVIALTLGAAAPLLPLPAGMAEAFAIELDPPLLLSAASLGAGIVLVASALFMPFILRYGMTKASRIAPVVIVVLLAAGIAAFPQLEAVPAFADFVSFCSDASNAPLLTGIAAAVVLAVYVASLLVAMRLYRSKDL